MPAKLPAVEALGLDTRVFTQNPKTERLVGVFNSEARLSTSIKAKGIL